MEESNANLDEIESTVMLPTIEHGVTSGIGAAYVDEDDRDESEDRERKSKVRYQSKHFELIGY